ncbi:MAG: AEC family transporter [Thermomicrobia bacterium]|nr:AEC family transporter [Thermomicrobia bacterium]
MGQLPQIYLNILIPVFALVVIGYVVGPRLGLEARTLSRIAYFVLVPSFTFNVLTTAPIDAGVAGRMVLYIGVVEVACAGAAIAAARLCKRSPEMTGAYILIAVFPNVGNFGLPIVQFAFGPDALVAATIYFIAMSTISFIIGVAAANWHHGSTLRSLIAVLKTPAVIAVVPALLFNASGIHPPLVIERPTGLLAGAMVPVMLLALGVQLAGAGIPRLSGDMLGASLVRLLAGPALAALIVIPFHLTSLARDAGVLQSAMPGAVLASIIAFEHDLLPTFVTATVLFSTLISIVTLAAIIAVL